MKKIKIGLVLAGITVWLVFGYATTKVGHTFYNYFSSSDSSIVPAESPISPPEESCGDNTIQVALLLDTSGSMNGLLEQAKSQLWNILNELARTEMEDEETELEIALYEYGTTRNRAPSNEIRQLSAFTSDMDLISEKLFALSTSGGNEYCGQVIQKSLNELEWKKGDDLKVIYIAGNESFTQGMISFKDACKNAVSSNVTINTIFCGDYDAGISMHWEEGAKAGKGAYLNIDHNQETAYIATPYDDEINDLNMQLNETYIPYGNEGAAKIQNQMSQDANSSLYSTSNLADRAVFKSSKMYKNTNWDLVDAYKKDKNVLKVAEVKVDSLQDVSIDDLEATINSISAERTQIQNEIQELDKKRRAYKTENTKLSTDESLQHKMINSIREQAKKKGYKVKE